MRIASSRTLSMIFCASALRSDSGRVKLKSKPGDDMWAGNDPRLLDGVEAINSVELLAGCAVDGGLKGSGCLVVLAWTLLGCIS